MPDAQVMPLNERATRSDYGVRLERVFGWLAENLDDTLDLARLADVACMSPYHFHRIYHAMQGETVADTVRPRDSLRSEACVVLPDGLSPSGELQVREIRGGRYAVTLHVGPYAELERPYKWLYGTWLALSGEEAADAPCVEEYLNDARTIPPTELKTEIWLPLR